jgi:polyisoprenoid-binding protein YceI
MRSLLIATALLGISCGSLVLAQQPSPPSQDPKAVTAGRYEIEPSHTRVQFTVSHMGFTKWYGDLTQVGGTLSIDPKEVSAAAVDITIPTASVYTTNTTLDGELRSAQWFDAERFPTIRFVSTKVVPTGTRDATITAILRSTAPPNPLRSRRPSTRVV